MAEMLPKKTPHPSRQNPRLDTQPLSILPCYFLGEGGYDQHSLCRQTPRLERSCSSTEETGAVGEPTISIQVEKVQKSISLSFGTIHQP